MTDTELTRLALAVLLQAPFAFAAGGVVREGRQYRFGSLFLAVGAGIAAITFFLTGSLLIAVPAALAGVLILAHARFRGAQSSAAVPPTPQPQAAAPPAQAASPPAPAAPIASSPLPSAAPTPLLPPPAGDGPSARSLPAWLS